MMDEKALYKLTYGLYVVSAAAGEMRGGCIVNTLLQVTAEPPRLCVTVNEENYTAQLIREKGSFAAVALDQRADLTTMGRFGFRCGRDFDKFDSIAFAEDENGNPYPLDAVCARFSCQVEHTMDFGTHLMFIGTVEEAEILGEHLPLTYTYYREVIKGKTPKNAPSFQRKG